MTWAKVPLLSLLLFGCDAQTGADYRGGPLAVLNGVVNNQSGLPPPTPIDAALLWRARDPSSPDAIMSATPVVIEKSFPAQFTITIYLPAPALAYQQSALPYAVANVGAIERGAMPAQILDGSGVLGTLADPLLYYFRSAVPSGLMQQQYGALKAGYHLIRRQQTIDPASLSQMQIDACANTLMGQLHGLALADAKTECAQSLLSHSSQETPLDTPLLLEVKNP